MLNSNTKRRKMVQTNKKMTILMFFQKILTADGKWCEQRVTEEQVGRSPQRHRGRPWEGVGQARGEEPLVAKSFQILQKLTKQGKSCFFP